MNSQWLTILKSRISETIEQNSIFDSPKVKVQQGVISLKNQLQTRKKQFQQMEISELIEEVSPPISREALSIALNLLRPFAKSLRFRVSHLTSERIEILIPFHRKASGAQYSFHEGVYTTVAVEALRLLWSRSLSLDTVKINIQEAQLKIFAETHENLRLRFELSEKNREAFLMQLRHQNFCQIEADFYFYDEHEKNVAQIHLHYRLSEEPVRLIEN